MCYLGVEPEVGAPLLAQTLDLQLWSFLLLETKFVSIVCSSVPFVHLLSKAMITLYENTKILFYFVLFWVSWHCCILIVAVRLPRHMYTQPLTAWKTENVKPVWATQ